MAARKNQPLYYFTIEDESILAEAFSRLPQDDGFAISYKVADSEDVFVTTSETRDAMFESQTKTLPSTPRQFRNEKEKIHP